MSFLAPVVATGLRTVGRYIYQGLRQQDKIIDYTYRKTGLYNRGVVKGIKHGLIAGQIAGGVQELGLSAPDTPGNGAQIQPQKPKYASRKSYQTRRRFTVRSCPKYPVKQQSYQKRRRSRFS